MAVTLVCIAIPSIIPLYLRVTKRASGNRSAPSTPYQKRSQGTGDTPMELQPVQPGAELAPKNEGDDRKSGVSDPFTEVNIITELW
ncbi:hypothetical protein ACHAQA_008575 [Verticillium albo-atrum]